MGNNPINGIDPDGEFVLSLISKIVAGDVDNNRSISAEIWQGISRNASEHRQTTVGYNYSQWRNTVGKVDRVDLFGGATFVTSENQDGRQGVSLGNFINGSIDDEITGTFENRVINDPLFMHEYGHTFDSQTFGPLYLPIIGLSSSISAGTPRPIGGGLSSHDIRWYEMSANRHAARYFGRHYGVNWIRFEPPLNEYPRRR